MKTGGTYVCLRLGAVAALALALAAPVARAQSATDIQGALDAAYAKYKDLKEGKNADYIPALAEVDPNIYGIALVTTDGKVYTTGDIKSEVSIQSISKVFTMAQVIQEQGVDSIAKRIGVVGFRAHRPRTTLFEHYKRGRSSFATPIGPEGPSATLRPRRRPHVRRVVPEVSAG